MQCSNAVDLAPALSAGMLQSDVDVDESLVDLCVDIVGDVEIVETRCGGHPAT